MTELKGINETCFVCGNEYGDDKHRYGCPNGPRVDDKDELDIRTSLNCPTCGSENLQHWHESLGDRIFEDPDDIHVECWGCDRTLLHIDCDGWIAHKWGNDSPWEGFITITHIGEYDIEWCDTNGRQRGLFGVSYENYND